MYGQKELKVGSGGNAGMTVMQGATPGKRTLTEALPVQAKTTSAGADGFLPSAPVKGLSPGLMAKLAREHAARREAMEVKLGEAEGADATEATRRSVLIEAAALLHVKIDTKSDDFEDLGGFDPGRWPEVELALQFDHLPPPLEADPRVVAEKASHADVIQATETLAAGYEALYARCCKLAARFVDQKFTKEFKTEFKNILTEAFTAADLTPSGLSKLLSPAQRAALSTFYTTRIIPDSLFTGADATGAASVPQRTLMSAHILEVGKAQKLNKFGVKEGEPVKPHAEFCGHWVQFVWSYAGVNTAKGSNFANQSDYHDVVGPTGNTSFGGGKLDTSPDAYYMGKEAKSPEEQAILPPAGDHKKAIEKNPKTFKRRWPLEEKVFTMLRPGDWIYIYNANASGEHSEIFVGWEKPDDAPKEFTDASGENVRYKTAKVYSQRNPDKKKSEGGAAHTQNLGYPYSDDPKLPTVTPVTAVMRPDASSTPPRTVDQLLPFNRNAAAEANLKHIAEVETTTKREIAFDKLAKQLSKKALELTDALQTLEPAQAELCKKIGADESATIYNISTLIALGQRVSLASAIDGILNPSNKQDAALLGPGGWGAVCKEKSTEAASGGLEFPHDMAIERNRHATTSQGVNIAKLVPAVADVARGLPATLKGKDKDRFDKHQARFDELMATHGAGATLDDLSVAIALWQFAKGKSVDGWTKDYAGVVGKAKLTEMTEPKPLK